jgi:N-dimethylarginine dimethylaminohydrolase
MNTELLVCDPLYFRIEYVINPYMDRAVQPEPVAAAREHAAIVRAHVEAGRRVRRLAPAPECPDMVYTANMAVVRAGRAVLGDPPPQRKAEVPYVAERLAALGLDVLQPPYPFSGQGDALACGDLMLCGYGRRTDGRVLPLLGETLDCEVIPLRTADERWYDLDLAVAVVDATTVAWHPPALDPPSGRRLRRLGLDLIEVDAPEAAAFALNLVSDGVTVTMPDGAPRLAAALRRRGLRVVELATTELRKGGGGIRCTALALDTPGRLR